MTNYLIAISLVALGLIWSGDITPTSVSDLMSQAEAVRGRPATPASYAGVARRTTRRTVAATTPNCVTNYNAYGQAVTTCY